MIKRLVIHLGDCKTGSTSLQTILSQKAWSDKKISKQIEYPCVFNHMRLAKSLISKKLSAQKEKLFLNINKRFEQSSAEIGILSAEQFEFVAPSDLNEAIQTYLPSFADNVQLIAYIRPHADRLLASYTERLKKGAFKGSLDEFYQLLKQRGTLNYSTRIQKWKNIFGERYITKPFIASALKDNDVVCDFFSSLLGYDNVKFTQPTRHNEAVSVEDLSVLLHLQKCISLDSQKSYGHARLGSLLAQAMTSSHKNSITKLKLHSTVALLLKSDFSQDAQSVDQQYFSESYLENALESSYQDAIQHPQSLAIEDYFNDSAVRIINCWIKINASMIDQDSDLFLKVARKPGRLYSDENSKI